MPIKLGKQHLCLCTSSGAICPTTGSATGRTALCLVNKDLAAVALHPRLNTHPKAHLHDMWLTCTPNLLRQCWIKLTRRLPLGGKLTQMGPLFSNYKAITFKKLLSNRPHLCRDTLRHDPA